MDNNNSNNSYSYNNYYGSESEAYGNASYQDLTGGFESGNPIVKGINEVKTTLQQEVVAKSFLFMFAALIVTAYAAYFTVSQVDVYFFVANGNFYGLLIAELVIVLVSNWAVHKNIPILAGILFTAYSFLTGMTLSVVLLLYTTTSVVSIFLVTAGLFAVMAVIGMATKADLGSLGSILIMGLIGSIAMSLVNIFILKSDGVDMAISAIGVLIFVGLTAYDVQKIKRMVQYSDSSNVLSLALYGAFELYLDFINLFLKLIRLFGKRNN